MPGARAAGGARGAIVQDAAARLLEWYDRHARVLPWRVGPAARAAGMWPDPYRVWLSEVMLQQTTVAAVGGYFERFTVRWPTLANLAAADDAEVMAEWAGLGYYARARNLLACARVVMAEYGGRFPGTAEALAQLPGVGPYTAAAVAAIAFDRPETVVDGNVERVVARLFAVETPLPAAKPVLRARAAELTPVRRAGDFAQGMMDLGATVCTPRRPTCGLCPLAGLCAARRAGLAETLPRRVPKAAKPLRFGQGLLGGMLGWPGSDWGESPAPAPPLAADWRRLAGEVRHTFTHFRLRLAVHVAEAGPGARPARGVFLPAPEFRPGDLPTLMRKVFDLAHKEF
ncbi:MAG: A/G-specific adenine glycosylase [Alphaproteobacteria bacterium HGW-Alphaproteobacteria-2]|nr:MAG: A/G-specific adenine glycosylase [Alphaproteobacteria bacterium HGW-Alphaproteobacteria-2]